jgi:hypothetical protein
MPRLTEHNCSPLWKRGYPMPIFMISAVMHPLSMGHENGNKKEQQVVIVKFKYRLDGAGAISGRRSAWLKQ